MRHGRILGSLGEDRPPTMTIIAPGDSATIARTKRLFSFRFRLSKPVVLLALWYIVFCGGAKASLPRDNFRPLEARPLRENYEELLKSQPSLQPTPNETLENRVRRIRSMAEQGDPVGEYGMAVLYVKGVGVPKNPDEAVRWCRKAAEAGLPIAQTHLGEMLDSGEGVSRDSVEAVKWYELAASKGFAPAKVNLGLSLTWGTGTATNFAKALALFHEADEAGYALANGIGVQSDVVEAYEWLLLASIQKDRQAMANLPAVESKLTPEQISEAKRRAQEFRPTLEVSPKPPIWTVETFLKMTAIPNTAALASER